ncbi:MAG: hypothetical protein ACU84J_03220 [Gammaproteobacteria bacterium]
MLKSSTINFRLLLSSALLAALPGHYINAAEVDDAYRSAVQDAAFAEESEVAKNLLAVDKENPQLVWNEDKSKVLVATWKSQGAYNNFLKPYDKTSDNPEYAVWVTTVPQVKQLCATWLAAHAGSAKEAVDLRLKQYLGLDPTWQYDVFVELWVDPKDMFRPCVDPETNDSSCNLNFDKENPAVTNIADYRDFYSDLYYKSFRGSAGVPWTGLGYTYDWGNPESEVGASEFILVPGAAYQIKDATPTMAYCGK